MAQEIGDSFFAAWRRRTRGDTSPLCAARQPTQAYRAGANRHQSSADRKGFVLMGDLEELIDLVEVERVRFEGGPSS